MTGESRNPRQRRLGGIPGHVPAEQSVIFSGIRSNNTLLGNAGDDTLIGGNGADIYSYATGHGADTIDNSNSDTAQDRLNVTNMTRSQVTFTRSGGDLLMSRNGSATDSVRVTNWFTVTDHQLNFVQFTDQTLTSAQINALFGGSLLSSLAIVEQPVAGDEWDRSLLQFVDAMNHYDDRRSMVVDQDIPLGPELANEWLTAAAAERLQHHRSLSGTGHALL